MLFMRALCLLSIPGLFNPSGLDSWREARDSGKELSIVHIGHSLEEGIQNSPPGDAANWFPWRYSNLLRKRLQERLYGVLGGAGFIPAVDSMSTPILAGTGSYLGGERFGVWNDRRFNDFTPAEGACRRYTESTLPGSYFRFYKHSGGVSDYLWAARPSYAQIVYQRLPGGGTFEVSITNYGGSTTYASFQVSTDGRLGYGSISPSLPLATGFWIKVTNVSSGSEPIRIEGVNFLSGGKEIRVSNYACGGATADAYLSDANVQAIARQKPNVVLLWLDHNDFFGSRAQGFKFWQTSLDETLGKLKASLPGTSVLMKLGLDFSPPVDWNKVQSAAEDLALKHNVALFSHHVYAERQQAWAYGVPLGILLQWKVHFTRDPGQVFEADLMESALLDDYPNHLPSRPLRQGPELLVPLPDGKRRGPAGPRRAAAAQVPGCELALPDLAGYVVGVGLQGPPLCRSLKPH
jgi:hypothetical protein